MRLMLAASVALARLLRWRRLRRPIGAPDASRSACDRCGAARSWLAGRRPCCSAAVRRCASRCGSRRQFRRVDAAASLSTRRSAVARRGAASRPACAGRCGVRARLPAWLCAGSSAAAAAGCGCGGACAFGFAAVAGTAGAIAAVVARPAPTGPAASAGRVRRTAAAIAGVGSPTSPRHRRQLHRSRRLGSSGRGRPSVSSPSAASDRRSRLRRVCRRLAVSASSASPLAAGSAVSADWPFVACRVAGAVRGLCRDSSRRATRWRIARAARLARSVCPVVGRPRVVARLGRISAGLLTRCGRRRVGAALPSSSSSNAPDGLAGGRPARPECARDARAAK